MDVFPTLSEGVLVESGYSEQQSSTGDLVSPTEAGYKITRPTFTRQVDTTKALYRLLDDSDKLIMKSFTSKVGTTGSFYWRQPITENLLLVRFISRPPIVRDGLYWAMDVELEEV